VSRCSAGAAWLLTKLWSALWCVAVCAEYNLFTAQRMWHDGAVAAQVRAVCWQKCGRCRPQLHSLHVYMLPPLLAACRINQFNNALNGFLRSKALLQAT
jgi:hypothetical protein